MVSVSDDKFILDACCGPRFMWLNKNHPNTIYIDIRNEDKGYRKDRPNLCIKPDIVMDFTKLDFPDECFKLIFWDPPHLRAKKLGCNLLKQYGALRPESWQGDLKKGFSELWRVLKPFGVLLFKWNNYDINVNKVLRLFPVKPLVKQTIYNKNIQHRTNWFAFIKIPEVIL